jgi:tetraacyldisaccharide 4'-kinase
MALQKAWFSKAKWVWVLSPLSLLFWGLSSCRRFLYSVGLKASYRANAKVIIVGNISVGGNGKTPLVIALASYLQEKGIKCGVLSRGYGGKQSQFPFKVEDDASAELVGDEPKLMAHRLSCPVVIDPKRARGAKYLCDAFSCDVIICDDGLQHYALQRDFEIVVMDARGIGNGFLLPMGPLRETSKRLGKVDAIVVNSNDKSPTITALKSVDYSLMTLTPSRWVNLKTKEVKRSITPEERSEKMSRSVTAIAGIGDPKRFFSTLESMNVSVDETIGFPDHYQYTQNDIPVGQVLMTEKDAVKIQAFAHDNCWYLEVEGQINQQLFNDINQKLALW